VDGFTINCNGKAATGIHFHRSSNSQIENNEIYGSISQEEDALISSGFDYVRFDDKEQVPIYRKRK
jgi:hypothetical protein